MTMHICDQFISRSSALYSYRPCVRTPASGGSDQKYFVENCLFVFWNQQAEKGILNKQIKNIFVLYRSLVFEIKIVKKLKTQYSSLRKMC